MPDSLLCTVPWQTTHKVACYMLDDFTKLNEAYKGEFGENIQINTDSDTAYRTFAQQENLYAELGPSQAAVPGQSNHGWGLAVDLAGTDYGTAKYNWLDANAGTYCFDDDVSSESWHWAYQR